MMHVIKIGPADLGTLIAGFPVRRQQEYRGAISLVLGDSWCGYIGSVRVRLPT